VIRWDSGTATITNCNALELQVRLGNQVLFLAPGETRTIRAVPSTLEETKGYRIHRSFNPWREWVEEVPVEEIPATDLPPSPDRI